MHRSEDGDALGRGEQAGRPCDGLEGCALVVAVAAIALPAPNREEKADTGVIGHPRELEIVRPTPRHGPAAGGPPPAPPPCPPAQPHLLLVPVPQRTAA